MPGAALSLSGPVARDRWDNLLSGALGALLLRPWYDRLSVAVLGAWYFPTSRIWAAAVAARGSAERFAEAAPTIDPGGRLAQRAVAEIDRLRLQHAAGHARWEDALFGGRALAGRTLARAEGRRESAAHALMLGRLICAPLHAVKRGPAVRFDVAGEAAVEARHGARLRAPDAAFAPSAPLKFERSHSFETRFGRVSWLRAPAPVPLAEGDGLRARVYEPARPRATVILAHGVGMEPEMWRGLAAPPATLIDAGCRVIQPEAPWHGNRAVPGLYGGEPVFAGGPLGLIDFVHAAVLELGHLIAWAKAFGDGPVALGGVSLGALTAQRLATAARAWPDSMRPDALFLVTASASIAAVAYSGSLPSALGVPEALAAAGWTRAKAERWAPLLEPAGAPAIPPERIVMLLGDADDVVPFREGLALAAAWAVPEANRFIRRRGHFTTALGLRIDDAPYRRMVEILAES